MVSSMTGYGRAEKYFNDFVLEAEIKSLNSRYLDINVKLPKNFSSKEFEIRDIIKKKFKRGKIGLFISVRKETGNGKGSFIDLDALKSVINSVEDIKKISGIKEELNLDHLLSLQTLFFTDTVLDPEEDFDLVREVIEEAINSLYEMRNKEGKELVNDISERLSIIEKIADEILQANKSSINEYYSKLYEKAGKLIEDFADDEMRFRTELALLTEKYDITEECVRLSSHIKLFRDSMANSGEIGRKLNFLCQEMNREANTINSKTVSSDISHKGIIIKEELEKIREQVQNIE